jgi:hypothetical protein
MRNSVFGAAILLAACSENQGVGLNPGRWEMVQESRVVQAPEGSEPGDSQSRTGFVCIDARQGGAPTAELLLGMEPDSCSGALDMAGGKVGGELTCRDGTGTGRKVAVKGKLEPNRFEVRDRQSTTVATGLSVGAGGTSTITAGAVVETRTTARRVGECEGNEVSLPI